MRNPVLGDPPDFRRSLKLLPFPQGINRETVYQVFLHRLAEFWPLCARSCYNDREIFLKRASEAVSRAWKRVQAAKNVGSAVGLLYHLIFENRFGRAYLQEAMDVREPIPSLPVEFVPNTIGGVLAEERRREEEDRETRLREWISKHPGDHLARRLALRQTMERRGKGKGIF